MKRAILTQLAAGFLALAALTALSAGPAPQTFTGVVTDGECPKADHSRMQMGPTDAECTVACIMYHGSVYLLYDGKNSYTLSDQETPEQFAGRKVKVIGTPDAANKTIQVDSITAAK